MKRFLILTAIIFGFMLSYQILKITAQRRYMADVNLKEIKGKQIKIISPDFFAERNIYESFNKRYDANLRYTLKDKPESYFQQDISGDVIIYPSLLYKKFLSTGEISPIDENKAKNIENLMDNFFETVKKDYTNNGKIYAIPIAYSPYAIYFNISKVNKSTKGKELIKPEHKIALADDIGSMLTLCKIFNIKPDKKGVEELKKVVNQKPVFFNIENPSIGLATLTKEKPDVLIAPSYLRGFFEREAGTFETVLPDEGTFATLYLISNLSKGNSELSQLFINHILDPTIHKNLTDIMGLGITNKTSLPSISAVYYNFLKMNYPDYLKNLYLLKSEEEYNQAVSLFKDFKSGF